jgi:hypothetical protein
VGCSTGSDNAPQAQAALPALPVIDLGSPEAALRSYWSLRDWRGITVRQSRPLRDPADVVYHRSMIGMTAGATRQFFENIEASIREDRQTRLERRILNIVQDSPERATIVANIRNVTPVPVDAKPPSRQLARLRETGEDYRYVLIRAENRWKVLQVWSLYMGERLQYDPEVPTYPAFVPPQ